MYANTWVSGGANPMWTTRWQWWATRIHQCSNVELLACLCKHCWTDRRQWWTTRWPLLRASTWHPAFRSTFSVVGFTWPTVQTKGRLFGEHPGQSRNHVHPLFCQVRWTQPRLRHFWHFATSHMWNLPNSQWLEVKSGCVRVFVDSHKSLR
jgi:hypothetical protein